MRRALQALADVLWPRGVKCLCCDEYSEGEPLCPACSASLQGMRLDPSLGGTPDRRGVYRYDGIAKRLVLLLKESCVADAALPLAVGIAKELRTMALPPDTVFTWVTMPDVRRRKRGIDHGRTLCEAAAAELGFPARQLLIRVKNTHTQRGLSHDERIKNLSGVFASKGDVHGTVVLIDDVMTTGTTGALCAKVLLESGASSVLVMTATRAMLHEMS